MSRKKTYLSLFLHGLSERIRKIRGELTQKDFGEIIQVKQATVYKYEKGMALPGDEALKKIADFGKVTVEWLLHGQEAPPAPQLKELGQEEYVATLNPLETALLIEVVAQIKEVISKHRQQLTPDQEARLIVRVYDNCRAHHERPSHLQVEKILLLVD